jgi:hypothetical protein
MEFKKNIAFTSLIRVGGRLSEFNFRKRGEADYDVDTSDERGNRLFLKVQLQSSDWKITNTGLPAWLMKCEEEIGEVIRNEENK